MRLTSLFALACLAGCGSWDPTNPSVPDPGFAASQPDFGQVVTRTTPPPPISGGTLTVLADGVHAVAADPDRDRIYVVDLRANTKVADLALSPGDEPGRVVEDGAGRVHVVLRSGGALVTIDPTTWTIAARRPVCPAPRGAAWDPATDLVHVACVGGELVSLPASGGPAVRTVTLDHDLRDVVVSGGQLYVTRFRSAELLTIDASGQIAHRDNPAGFAVDLGSTFTPDAAWRMVAAPDGVYVVHQRALNGIVHTGQGGYGDDGDGSCSTAIVHSTVTHFVAGQDAQPGPTLPDVVVPVDVAVAHGSDPYLGTEIAVVSAGNAKIDGAPVVVTYHETHGSGGGSGSGSGGDCDGQPRVLAGGIEPIAVAYTLDDQLLVQSREPARLINETTGEEIDLASDSVADTGHDVFHANAGAGVACASCHLEGGDDGRVWRFDSTGLRRTQALRGGILGTEPFHWDGDEADFTHLAHDVFESRMAGPALSTAQLTATAKWVDSIPLIPKAPGDAAAIARGKALFDDASGAGCITCHNGPKMTNSALVDVGTSGTFKVPRLLGLVDRAPYLHDGRAATLADRFTVGGGDMHGRTSQLTAAQIADLVAYLESL